MPCTVSRWSSSDVEWPASSRLPAGHGRAQHQVAEDALLGLLVDQPGAQLVHREGQHVGGALLLHPLLVELGDGGLVDGLDAQLGQRVDPHPVHHEARQPRQRGDVDVDAGLVEDLDAHRSVARCLRDAARRRASKSSYAATMWPTSRWRTTSCEVSRLNATSSMPVEDVLHDRAGRCGCRWAGRPG